MTKIKNIVLTCWFSGNYICKITSTLFPTKDFDQQQREGAASPTTSSLSPRWEIYPFREKSNQKFYLPEKSTFMLITLGKPGYYF